MYAIKCRAHWPQETLSLCSFKLFSGSVLSAQELLTRTTVRTPSPVSYRKYVQSRVTNITNIANEMTALSGYTQKTYAYYNYRVLRLPTTTPSTFTLAFSPSLSFSPSTEICICEYEIEILRYRPADDIFRST